MERDVFPNRQYSSLGPLKKTRIITSTYIWKVLSGIQNTFSGCVSLARLTSRPTGPLWQLRRVSRSCPATCPSTARSRDGAPAPGHWAVKFCLLDNSSKPKGKSQWPSPAELLRKCFPCLKVSKRTDPNPDFCRHTFI